MKVSRLIEHLLSLPQDSEVFFGTYEMMGNNGKETWTLCDPSFYFRESVNSCKSSRPSHYSVKGPTLIVSREECPETDNPFEE